MTMPSLEIPSHGANLGGETLSVVSTERLIEMLSLPPDPRLLHCRLYSPILNYPDPKIDQEPQEPQEPFLDYKHISVLGLARTAIDFGKAGVQIDWRRGIISQKSENIYPKSLSGERIKVPQTTGSPVVDGVSESLVKLFDHKEIARVCMHLTLANNPFVLAIGPGQENRDNVMSVSAIIIR